MFASKVYNCKYFPIKTIIIIVLNAESLLIIRSINVGYISINFLEVILYTKIQNIIFCGLIH